MASIRQRDGKFQVRIIRIGHRALSKTFTNRGDAVKWARAVEVEIERGAIQTHTRSITLSDAIEQYRRERTPHKKSARSERYILDAWARSSIAGTPLSQIRPAQIAEWRDARTASGAAPQTVRNDLTTLSAIYQQAIREWGFDHLSTPVSPSRTGSPSLPRRSTRHYSFYGVGVTACNRNARLSHRHATVGSHTDGLGEHRLSPKNPATPRHQEWGLTGGPAIHDSDKHAFDPSQHSNNIKFRKGIRHHPTCGDSGFQTSGPPSASCISRTTDCTAHTGRRTIL